MKLFPRYQTKNLRLLFYIRGIYIYFTDGRAYAAKLRQWWQAMSEDERSRVRQRVDYYCRLQAPFAVGDSAVSIRAFRKAIFAKRRNYFFDLYEHVRHFDRDHRFHYRFGDQIEAPERPCFVKARLISAPRQTAVLLNLNKIRHFNFVKDNVPFEDKKPALVWRGLAYRKNRAAFLEKFYDHPSLDVGQTRGDRWRKPYLTIREQLAYKFVLSLEGNDVATNLKWIMSSGSVCFMPRPTRETWFMEGTLQPGVHYVEIRDDYADLEEKVAYFTKNTDQARRIVTHANHYVAQFQDADLEALIAMKVVEKYFALSGQPSSGQARAGAATSIL